MKPAQLIKNAAGAAAGIYVCEMYVLKATPDGDGMVLVEPGFGWDDIVKALFAAGGVWLANEVF